MRNKTSNQAWPGDVKGRFLFSNIFFLFLNRKHVTREPHGLSHTFLESQGKQRQAHNNSLVEQQKDTLAMLMEVQMLLQRYAYELTTCPFSLILWRVVTEFVAWILSSRRSPMEQSFGLTGFLKRPTRTEVQTLRASHFLDPQDFGDWNTQKKRDSPAGYAQARLGEIERLQDARDAAARSSKFRFVSSEMVSQS